MALPLSVASSVHHSASRRRPPDCFLPSVWMPAFCGAEFAFSCDENDLLEVNPATEPMADASPKTSETISRHCQYGMKPLPRERIPRRPGLSFRAFGKGHGLCCEMVILCLTI